MKLCHRDELNATGSKAVNVGGQSFFVVRQQQRFYAYENRCPHLGIELNWLPDGFLSLDQSLIQCSTHGAMFVIDSGECVAGPCLGRYLQPLPVSLDQDGNIHTPD